MSKERIISVSRCVPRGSWTTYADVGEVVYGHRKAGQTVGIALRGEGHEDSAHRTLRAGGKVSAEWLGAGGGPEECIRRLRAEDVWDETRNRARPDAFVDAAELRRLEA